MYKDKGKELPEGRILDGSTGGSTGSSTSLTVLSGIEGLTILSAVEVLTILSEVEGLKNPG